MIDEGVRFMLHPPQFSMAAKVREMMTENPCAEQPVGFKGRPLGGKHVDYCNNIEGEGIMIREWLNTDEDENIDVNAIVSYKFSLHEISAELSVADVWTVELTATLVTGAHHSISGLKELLKFVRSLDGDKPYTTADSGSLGYYVLNAMKHDEMVERAEKLNG